MHLRSRRSRVQPAPIAATLLHSRSRPDSSRKALRLLLSKACLLQIVLSFHCMSWSDAPTLLSRDWSRHSRRSAIWIAVEMRLPFNSPCDPCSDDILEREEISCLSYREPEHRKSWTQSGGDGDAMILLQCKYPESVPRVYKSSQPTELEVDGVNISFTPFWSFMWSWPCYCREEVRWKW